MTTTSPPPWLIMNDIFEDQRDRDTALRVRSQADTSMWLITGPFESEQLGDEVSQKTKLLKTNRAYDVGRHETNALWINNKKVSRLNGEFIVGEHSEDDVSNGTLVPTLSFRNNKTSAMKITRGENVVLVNPDSTHEIETGDVVKFSSTIEATVTWEPKVCFYTHTNDFPTFDLATCASMGLKLVTKHTRDVTHHLTPGVTPPLAPSVFYSLLAPARFVKPEWAAELIRRATDAKGLEKTYEPPLENAFRPAIDPVFAEQNPVMAKQALWDPSEDRKALFEGIRFIFAVIGSGAGSTAKAMADVVSRGGADRQLVNVEKEAEEQAKGAAGTWGSVLKKRKVVLREGMRSGLVLVGDEEAMTARGVPKEVRKAWEVMVEKARRVNMRVIPPSFIAEAIFKADVSVLDCVAEGDSEANASEGPSIPKSLPDHIPSIHPEEPSQPPSTTSTRPARRSRRTSAEPEALQTSGAGPSRRLTRRGTSQTSAPDPAPPVVSMDVEEEVVPPMPRKLLKRRAKTGGLVNELLGLDDTTVMEASQSQEQSQPAMPLVQAVVPPTPARPGRLKRRVGTAAPSSQLFPDLQSETQADGEEPPLKKFKALFDQSGQGGGTDQTDAEMPASGSGGVSGTQLTAVREEEDEEETRPETQGRKRKADAMQQEEEERDADVEMPVAEGSSAAKKRAIEAVNAVEPSQKRKPPATNKPPSRATTTVKGTEGGKTKGAAPGEPDTDPSFLRAIASTKRGKKTEDEFDREFNKLRIAKPDINHAGAGAGTGDAAVQWAQEWNGLDDFEKDAGIRGNFMRIVEVEVWKDVAQDQPGRNVRRESGLGARMDWDGRQDFKKFKRKMGAQPREHVSLLVSDHQQDYGTGEPYWGSKGGKASQDFDDLSQSQDHSYSQPTFTQTQSAPKSRPKSQPKPKPKPRAKSKAAVVEELDDDDEVEDEVGEGTKAKAKSRATGKGKASQAEKKVQALFDMGSEEDEDAGAGPSAHAGAVVMLDDEEEDLDLTLRSTKRTTQDPSPKGKLRGTKRKAVMEDSDSDEGLTFGGFAKKVKKRK